MIIYFVKGTNADGKQVSENRILEMSSNGIPGNPVTLNLKQPFSNFITATPRAGSEQSDIIDNWERLMVWTMLYIMPGLE